MLKRLFGPSRWERPARSLYETIVVQSRRPEFYREGAVADTLDGRFDVIVLHLVLVLRRLRAAGPQTAPLAQALFDLMHDDMDANLREIGVGDLSVGRKVKAMAKAVYGRIEAYDSGLTNSAKLHDALGRNLYRGREVDAAAMDRVARYVVAAADRLAAQDESAMLDGRIDFPAPDLT